METDLILAQKKILDVLDKRECILPSENDGKFVRAYREELLELRFNLKTSHDFLQDKAFSGRNVFAFNGTKNKVMDIVSVVNKLLDQYSQIGLSPGDGVVVRCMKRGFQHLLVLRLHKRNQELFKLTGTFVEIRDEFRMQQLIGILEQLDEAFFQDMIRIQQQTEQLLQQTEQLLQQNEPTIKRRPKHRRNV